MRLRPACGEQRGRTVALLVVAICGCAGATPQPARRGAPPAPQQLERARLVVLGDTGKPSAELDEVMAAVAAEAKDAVLDLGDLVYPYAPRCPDGRAEGEAKAILERKLLAPLSRLGAPVLLALGNHDKAFRSRSPERTACLIDFAAAHPQLVLPARDYVVDLGVAIIAVVDTNDLDGAAAEMVAKAFKGHKGWRVIAGHHVLKTWHDKEREDVVLPWMRRHGLKPDLYLNGHAHLLQFAEVEGIWAITSGATAKLRERPACPPDCGEGQAWGRSIRGYAVVELTADERTVIFRDARGETLWQRRGARR